MPEHLLGDFRGLGGILGNLHSAAFAAAAGMNLRFHHHASADLLRGALHLVDGERNLAPRHRDIVLGQDRLGLILVNFHGVKV